MNEVKRVKLTALILIAVAFLGGAQVASSPADPDPNECPVE
ncbi:hypothetical protein [Terasakiella sp.]